MIEKLSVASGFMFFLLVAVGVAISSNDHSAQILYEGRPGLDATIDHVFYGLNFAVMITLLSLVSLIAMVSLLALAIISILLGVDRVVKPLNAMEKR